MQGQASVSRLYCTCVKFTTGIHGNTGETHSLTHTRSYYTRWLSHKGYYYVRQMVRSLNHIQSVLYKVHDSLNHIQRVPCKVMTQPHTEDTIRGRWLSHKGYYVRQMVRSLNHIESVLNKVHDSLYHIQRVRCKVMNQSQRVFWKADGSVAQSHTKCTIQDAWLNHIRRVLCKVMTQPHTEDTIWGRRLIHKGYCVNQMVRSLNQSVLYNVHDSVTYKVDCVRKMAQLHAKSIVQSTWLNDIQNVLCTLDDSLNYTQMVLYKVCDSQRRLCKVDRSHTRSHTQDIYVGRHRVR